MSKTAIMTDSNCGLTIAQAKELGCFMLNMPVVIDGKTYIENEDIDTEFFYTQQANDADVTSSQPSVMAVTGMWKQILKEYDEIVYIPMTSGLSGSYESAVMFSREFDGKVHVVDNHRISVTQMASVLDAIHMRDAGMDAESIRTTLEKEALDASIYITVNTLKYLVKGGRITPGVAMLGSLLQIKPVLTIQGEKLDTCSKARGMKAAFRIMCEHLRKDLDTRFRDLADHGELALGMAYTYMSEEEKTQWQEKLQDEFPGLPLYSAPLTMSIGCHVGPGALGVGLVRIHK
ncbi:MAG: DegV family protein [Bulleidia sp.]